MLMLNWCTVCCYGGPRSSVTWWPAIRVRMVGLYCFVILRKISNTKRSQRHHSSIASLQVTAIPPLNLTILAECHNNSECEIYTFTPSAGSLEAFSWVCSMLNIMQFFRTSKVLVRDRLWNLFCYFKLIFNGPRNRLPNQHIQLAWRVTVSRSHAGLFFLKVHDIVIVLHFLCRECTW